MVDDPLSSSSPSPSNSAPSSPPPASAILRIVWMASIPVVFFVLLLIAEQERWTFGGHDIALGVIVVAALGARAADALWYRGTTAQGDPADRSHVLGYAARLVPLASVGWLLAQSVAL